MFEISLIHYILLSTMLFCIGLLSVIMSKHLIRVLIGIEFMFNAININLVACSNFNDFARLDGDILSLFVMAVAVCELAIGLAILFLIFRQTQSVNADEKSTEGEKWN